MKNSSEKSKPQELTDDIEVISPGQMLSEARKALSLSQEDVAKSLNFRLKLVQDIESDNFDKSLPATFNRGYLRNFAKLVNLSEVDILASYDVLGVAEKQGAEMQSFSQGTQREAENSRIKWMSYLMVAIIIGSTLVWFFQEPTTISSSIGPETTENSVALVKGATSPASSVGSLIIEENSLSKKRNVEPQPVNNNDPDNIEEQSTLSVDADTAIGSITQPLSQNTAETNAPTQVALIEEAPRDAINKGVAFTFKGDCWVNIYDATGEHIAWGVKKSGYVMKIQGVAPFSITLGKPELVAIEYDGNNIDMSQFNRGNIAKFTLPLTIN